MKRRGILNSKLSELVAKMGHGDLILIGDIGCPFPRHEMTKTVDLAVTDGVPKVTDVLKVVMEELVVEGYIVAEETKKINPEHYAAYKTIIENYQNKGNPLEEQVLPHSKIKNMWLNGAIEGEEVKVFVRTGERSPYDYIFLRAGVDF